MPVEAYRGSVEATKELFRICSLMWHIERIPLEPVRCMFVMPHKKGPRDDYEKGRFLYNAVSSPLDCSNHFTLFLPIHRPVSDRHGVAGTTSAPLGGLYR